jgi:hypothetical protein
MLQQEVLKESIGNPSLGKVHEELLMGFASHALKTTDQDGNTFIDVDGGSCDATSRRETVRHVARTYLPSGKVWASMFKIEKDAGKDSGVLQEIYERWKMINDVEARLAWATWLLGNGEGNKARELVVRSRSCLDGDERKELETRWAAVLDGIS